ncbi:hypothetical protein WICMUC_002889 [Wickerhamomyces mucosus]|uniref:Zn(2)-C6 fungal-type domain-containing protein n=1 Tax=Wickerhamomyces mucosus TaxID=1378264 RepID=A0A9P8PP46_9ASCO|nr:hypothetical protein WICMUC_002889 [Wickerhamomyces mucosus]
MMSKAKKSTTKEEHKKRNRVPVSCTICRRRKVKCSKERPVCKGCEKTGVGHLCHYIDPKWTQPLSTNELNSDIIPSENQEVLRLRERIKILEMELYGTSPGQDKQHSNSLEVQQISLGQRFDMLHHKGTNTVHLGTTSWLAIMKGDPYLRVLWAHIFKMRKQVEEFKKRMIQQSKNQNQNDFITDIGKCPVMHNGNSKENKCPVVHNHEEKIIRKYPISLTENAKEVDANTSPLSPTKCDKPDVVCPVTHRTAKFDAKCPVIHKSQSNDIRDTQTNISAVGTKPQPTAVEFNEENGCPLMFGDNTFLKELDKQKTENKQNVEGEVRYLKKSLSTSDTRHKRSNQFHDSLHDEDLFDQFKENPINTIEKLLPNKKTLDLLIDRFFDIVYIYMPFVDEESFRKSATLIFQGEQKLTLNVSKSLDFAFVGTVCIILRLSWLSLPKNSTYKYLKKTINNKTYQEDLSRIEYLQLPENEVSDKLIDFIKTLFMNLQLSKKSCIETIQCSLFTIIYSKYSPHESNTLDGSDSQLFLGMIVTMAMKFGLYRDPSNFDNFKDEKQGHLWRKIWYCLINLDVEQSMNLGCPLMLSSQVGYSDTQLVIVPAFEDDLKELTVIQILNIQNKFDNLITKSLKILLNIKTSPKKYQIDELITLLTDSVSGFNTTEYSVPQLGEILVNRHKSDPLYSSALRAYQFKFNCLANMMIYLLNYILFINFEPTGTKDIEIYRVAKDYAQSALDSALEGYRNCTLFFDCGLDYFGPGADLILSPLLLLIGHRSIQFMVSLILRSRCGPYMKPHIIDKDNYNKDQELTIKDEEPAVSIDELHNFYKTDVDSGEKLAMILLTHMENFSKLTNELGEKYQYSWRMSKAVKFFITLLRKPVNIVKAIVKTENVRNVENNTGFVSNILNSVPLILSSEEEGYAMNNSESISSSNSSNFSSNSRSDSTVPSETTEFSAETENDVTNILTDIPDFIVPNSDLLFNNFNDILSQKSYYDLFNTPSSKDWDFNNLGSDIFFTNSDQIQPSIQDDFDINLDMNSFSGLF